MPQPAGKEVHRDLHLVSPQQNGPDVRALQQAVNRELDHRKLGWRKIQADGEFGRMTLHACEFLGWVLGLPSRYFRVKGGGGPMVSEVAQRALRDPAARTRRDRIRERARKRKVANLRHDHRHGPRAATELIRKLAKEGVHETGSTNTGEWVDRLTGYFGLHAVPWCGCLAGYAAKVAGGSTATTWFPYGPSIMADAKAGRNGVREVAFDQIEEGDVLVLWGGAHVVTAAAKPVGELIETGEGNTSPNDGDSQADGGCVAMKHRSRSDVSCVARPY